jgi:hypothetical protein
LQPHLLRHMFNWVTVSRQLYFHIYYLYVEINSLGGNIVLFSRCYSMFKYVVPWTLNTSANIILNTFASNKWTSLPFKTFKMQTQYLLTIFVLLQHCKLVKSITVKYCVSWQRNMYVMAMHAHGNKVLLSNIN